MVKTIMVVDDEPDNIATVKTVLEANKFNVCSAINADDCLEQINSGKKPNLILMDVMMPGTPVSKIIPKIKDIPIAFLTVVRMSDAEKEEILGQKNVIDYIQKPFDVGDLLKRVKKLVG